MSIAEARIETERPSRYLVQLCKHASAIGRSHEHDRGVQVEATWSDSDGTITFTPWGRCTAHAEADALTLRVQAGKEEDLQAIQDIVTKHLRRFSRNELTATWQRTDTGSDAEPHPAMLTERNKPASRWARIKRISLAGAAAVTLLVALHLGLGGALVASTEWTSMAIGVVVALVLLKIGLGVLGGASVSTGTGRRKPFGRIWVREARDHSRSPWRPSLPRDPRQRSADDHGARGERHGRSIPEGLEQRRKTTAD